jgi:hypothetical protein
LIAITYEGPRQQLTLIISSARTMHDEHGWSTSPSAELDWTMPGLD